MQERLLGDWTSADGKEKLKLRRFDDSIYTVTTVICSALITPMLGTPFASVQDLNSSDRKYAFVVWKLSDGGGHLRLRNVSDKVIPKETINSATIVALLTKNAGNPELFGEEIDFRKEK